LGLKTSFLIEILGAVNLTVFEFFNLYKIKTGGKVKEPKVKIGKKKKKGSKSSSSSSEDKRRKINRDAKIGVKIGGDAKIGGKAKGGKSRCSSFFTDFEELRALVLEEKLKSMLKLKDQKKKLKEM